MPQLEQWQIDHVMEIIAKSPLSFDDINMAIISMERKRETERAESKPLPGQLHFNGEVVT